MAKVPLAIVRWRGWWNDELGPPPPPIKRAQPLWRARRGFKIHRPIHGRVHLHDRGRISFTWHCGNQANNPIPVTPECMDGLEPCVVCDAKFKERGGEPSVGAGP